MANEQSRNEIVFVVRWAAIKVPEERLANLEAGLSGTRTQAAALSRYDYGLTEPASRFIPPASR